MAGKLYHMGHYKEALDHYDECLDKSDYLIILDHSDQKTVELMMYKFGVVNKKLLSSIYTIWFPSDSFFRQNN